MSLVWRFFPFPRHPFFPGDLYLRWRNFAYFRPGTLSKLPVLFGVVPALLVGVRLPLHSDRTLQEWWGKSSPARKVHHRQGELGEIGCTLAAQSDIRKSCFLKIINGLSQDKSAPADGQIMFAFVGPGFPYAEVKAHGRKQPDRGIFGQPRPSSPVDLQRARDKVPPLSNESASVQQQPHIPGRPKCSSISDGGGSFALPRL